MNDFLTTARQIVADQERRAATSYKGGVSWSGMSPERPTVERVEDVVDRLERVHAAAKAFRDTPRGRFVTAVDSLQESGGFEAEALRLRGFYNRSLADAREPLNVHAVADCLEILATIRHSDAFAATLALAELLKGA